ncbi:MAG: acetyl-CoA hydrolase/transferase family protein [Paracoccaceae bacterium]
MLRRTAAAPAQRISAQAAAALVRSDMWVDYSGCLSQPDAFDRELALRVGELSRVGVRSTLSMRARAVLEADPEGQHICAYSLHFSGYDRRKHDAGITTYLPSNLGEIADYYRRFIPPVDILVLKARPVDETGTFNLGPTSIWNRAIIERAKCVIVEECAAMPYAVGEDNNLHISEVDYIIPGDGQPLPELPKSPATDVDRAVARLIMGELEDGSCLQIGIGGMPNAVCTLLADSSIRDLGVHTEMLTDGIVDLYHKGLITGSRKTLNPGKIVYTFTAATQGTYDTVDSNPDFLCCAVDYTNLPHMIMQNDRMVAINNTTQVDLQGQAASESDGHRHISGTGGQAQFVRGAYASKGGKSFICLSSTYDKKGTRKSRIELSLTRGNICTTTRSDMMYVVTEYGIVNLKGKSVAERATALISIAHPDFREELAREARENRLIPRGFF